MASITFFSCRCPKFTEGTAVYEKDTILVHDTIIPVDVPIKVKGDSARLKDTINEIPSNVERSKEVNAGHTTAKYSIKNKVLTVECNTAPYEDTIKGLKVKLQTLERSKSKETIKTIEVEKKVKVPVVPKWCWILLSINAAVVGFYLYSKGILGSAWGIIKKLF